MGEEETCRIHIPDDFEEKSTFLVNFSNGQLANGSKNPNITLYTKVKDRTKRKKILVAESQGSAYVGTNFGPGSAALGNSCQFCVGALDRSTGIMTLHKTELITLNPYIPGAANAAVGEEIGVPDDEEEKHVNAQKSADQLVQVFGSEKRKRAFSAAQRNVVGTDVLETALEPAFARAKTKESSAGSIPQDSGLMPPHNPAAELPQDVYDVSDIVSLSELKILKHTAKEFTEATSAEVEQWRIDSKYPDYVIQHIRELPSTEPNRSLKSALLLYAGYLIQMHNMVSRKVQRGGLQFTGVLPPGEVLEQLLSKFTEKQAGTKKSQYCIPVRMKDKIRLHLLVLCLIIDDFTVHCSVLQRDLKITTNKMTDYFKALGCVVQKRGVKRHAGYSDSNDEPGQEGGPSCILRIPLAFPKPRVARKRKE